MAKNVKPPEVKPPEEDLEADLIVMGQSRGKLKIGRNSILGMLLTGKIPEAMAKAKELQAEINRITKEGSK